MIWMHMDGRGCLPYVRLITGTGGNTMKLRRYPGVREILDRIFILLDKSDGMDPHELSVCVHYFFSLMMRSAQERFETEIERSIRESAAYIRVHYAKENLSVPHLAGREAMSVSYYVRSFRKIMGVTPHQYILQARINAARELLDTTSLSVETIAEHSGFCSASHLISAFRKETGMTPLQFRNLWR
jgi:AraC-like DNA-binding protein